MTYNNLGVFFGGKTITRFTNVMTLEQLTKVYVRKCLEAEGEKIEKGKLKEALQKFTNEVGEVTLENLDSDEPENTCTIVSWDEAASNLCNRGWMVNGNNQIDNLEQYKLICNLFKTYGINDYQKSVSCNTQN